ncbi:hypothetical protein DFH28DRAFT_928547 [Melampsora americana]|nr:hypothetical protein DFH28DRAFT_928547 [Melampsora americana]
MRNNTMADSTNQHMNVVLATLPQCNSSKPSPCPRSGRNCQELLRPSQTISGQPMLCLQTACAEGGLQTAKPSRGVRTVQKAMFAPIVAFCILSQVEETKAGIVFLELTIA